MVRNRFHIYILAVALVAGAGLGRAATIIGALEDTPGNTGYEKNGDFNDMMFEVTGNITIQAPGGVFNNLTSGVVNENGTVFWDNRSLDGPDMNAGFMLLGDNAFHNLQYLALADGSSVNDVTFDATGPVTFSYLGGIAADKQDTVGWYSAADPAVLNQLAAVTEPEGVTATFDPNGEFALYASTGSWGQVYNSVASGNIGDSGSQQHFAFFEEPGCQPPPQVPEPSTAALGGIGMTLMGAGLVARRRKQ
jgi:hypothetical protein